MSSPLYAVEIFKFLVLLEVFSSQFKKIAPKNNLTQYLYFFFLQKLSINYFKRFLEDFQKKYYLSVDM